MDTNRTKLKIFTWHIHGSYLYYLSQGPFDIYVPINSTRTEGYYGRGTTYPFGDNVREVQAEEVRNLSFDCVLFQSKKNFLVDQYELLSASQRQLPRLYVEHNTPEDHPVNTRHPMNDPSVVLVHVTHFNRLMWDTDSLPFVTVIEHGVCTPTVRYLGSVPRGVVIINHPKQRGRITGWDILEKVQQVIPLDIVGMGTEAYGGLGEVPNPKLPAFICPYRFLFNPIRYTSLGLAVCEAMMLGMPIVALATTEYATVIQNGQSGFIDTNLDRLLHHMQSLLNSQELAHQMGQEARRIAELRFNIQRFTTEWNEIFHFALHQTNGNHEKVSLYQ